MPAKHLVNLLPRDKFDESNAGKAISWATTVGRWIVVFTDLIVIGSFLSRFYFDTKLADYHDSIQQKQAIIEATSSFEDSFRSIQKRIILIRTLLTGGIQGENKVNFLNEVLPSDVFLTNLAVGKEKVSLTGMAFSQAGMETLLRNFLYSQKVKNLEIVQLSMGIKDNREIINFILNAGL